MKPVLFSTVLLATALAVTAVPHLSPSRSTWTPDTNLTVHCDDQAPFTSPCTPPPPPPSMGPSIRFADERITHGWARRLDVQREAKAFDQRLLDEQRASTSADKALSASSLFPPSALPTTSFFTFVHAWLFSAYHRWLDGTPFDSQHGKPTTTTAWKDATPRFVAYGDRYLSSNSFGIPDPKALKGFTYYNIAFWVSNGGAADNVQEWTKASSNQQKALVKAYNDAGIRLGIAVFGAEDHPQSNGNDPTALGQKIARFVKKHNLQGVDVDYEEYDKFDQRQATKWIIPLTRALRADLPAESYYISHAPIAPLFNTDSYPLGYTWVEQRIGSLIDFYNVQFYNQGDYLTCQSTTIKATAWPGTSLLELNSKYKIPLDKIVLGKPALRDDADDGFLTAGGLGNCLAKYAIPAGWKAGCMWWEYRGDLQSIIKPIKEATGL